MAGEGAHSIYRFEPLNPEHELATFDSGSKLLNDFLIQKALAEHLADRARTFVLLDLAAPAEYRVVGYFTLRADSYYFQAGGLAPVVELSWLARHQRMRGQGVGSVLLAESFRIAAQASDLIGISGMQLPSTDEGFRLYDRFGFVAHRYGADMLFISIAEIRRYVSEVGGDTE